MKLCIIDSTIIDKSYGLCWINQCKFYPSHQRQWTGWVTEWLTTTHTHIHTQMKCSSMLTTQLSVEARQQQQRAASICWGPVAQLAAGCCSKTLLKGSGHSWASDVNQKQDAGVFISIFIWSLYFSEGVSCFTFIFRMYYMKKVCC